MRNEEILHEMNNQEMIYNFPEMSKKDLEAVGAQKAQELIEQGELNEFQVLASAERLKTFAESFIKVLRPSIVVPEKTHKAFGVEFSTMNTGDRMDFDKDDVYAKLKDQLKQREELLKVALKSDSPIYDSDGVEVPKVPVKTYGSEVLKIKF